METKTNNYTQAKELLARAIFASMTHQEHHTYIFIEAMIELMASDLRKEDITALLLDIQSLFVELDGDCLNAKLPTTEEMQGFISKKKVSASWN